MTRASYVVVRYCDGSVITRRSLRSVSALTNVMATTLAKHIKKHGRYANSEWEVYKVKTEIEDCENV